MLMDRRVLILVLIAIVQMQSAFADSPKITAVLTSSDVVVGETVQLQIQIDNAGTSVNPPREIDVPGLRIHYTGESTQMTMRNLSISSSITYNYTILPEKSGTYKIPPQSIRVGKDNLQTPELMLRVADSPGATARAGSTRAPSSNTQAGEDPFSDPFFALPFGGLMEQHEINVKSDPVSLEVKALPAGAPPTFSGAVGSFSMTAEANPKRVQVGDPITIKAAISGRGNFDRMNAPELSDERGWHKYPPSSNFKQDDDVGISVT